MEKIILWKISSISGLSIGTYYSITKNDNMGSSTVHLHGVDLIDMHIHDWL